MSKKRTVSEQWYDIFTDAGEAEQAIMLSTLQTIHRQSKRGKLAPAEQEQKTQEQKTLELKEPANG